MAKRGPKPKEINWDVFDKLCALHCTLKEMSGILQVSEDTIERLCKKTFKLKFADLYQQKAASGRMSIRRKQFDIAMNGNVTMLIWLGKQWLGQKDKHEISDAESPKNDEELKYVPRSSIVWNKPQNK